MSESNNLKKLIEDAKQKGIEIKDKTSFLEYGMCEKLIDDLNEHFKRFGKYGILLNGTITEEQYELFEYLVKLGFDVNEVDEDDFPLKCASKIESVELVMKCGANINQYNVEGVTGLINACQDLNYKKVKLLLEHGADCNITDCNGNTALTIIFRNDYCDLRHVPIIEIYNLCRMLIYYGAKVENKLLELLFNVSELDDINDLLWLFTSSSLGNKQHIFDIDNIEYFNRILLLNKFGITRYENKFERSTNNDMYMIEYLVKQVTTEKRQQQKIYYNFVFKFISDMTSHIKLKPNNLGAQIIKLNFESKHKELDEIYKQLLKDKSRIISYLDIQSDQDLLVKIKQYVEYSIN